ncbi:MAG: helix-hairpin-helix domain-containing protein [Melioribacteraceae bacterium]|nr:helix-hairpin-helix domain-containing protein [Melioribacteraceae bacterium]
MKLNFFNKLIGKIGFTETEGKVILFLLFTIITGSIIKYTFSDTRLPQLNSIDYSKEDSLFFLQRDTIKAETEKNVKKSIASKAELLDFNANKIESHKIDINKAGISELILLPGIGEKTARKIIDYRKLNGSFEKEEDLIKVKGIGQIKFSKIKNYIIVK